MRGERKGEGDQNSTLETKQERTGRTDIDMTKETDGRPTGAEQQIVVFVLCCCFMEFSWHFAFAYTKTERRQRLASGWTSFLGGSRGVADDEGGVWVCSCRIAVNVVDCRLVMRSVVGGDGDGSDFRVGGDSDS